MGTKKFTRPYKRPPILDGSRVTKARLFPNLSNLLQERCSSGTAPQTPIPEELIEALQKHVFNKMPFRLVLLVKQDDAVMDMKLVGRSEIVDHITSKMTSIVDGALLDKMETEIDNLGKAPPVPTPDYQEEEDAREDPWKAICDFLFQEFARYTILSHTWLQSGEITYQNAFQSGWSGLDKAGPGAEKLKGFFDATHRDHNINLAWIDTLCINQDSSAELDEAIRSMYKWYENAAICITYLRDTTSLKDMNSDNWFCRGWTLQELIAPKNMQFYRGNWTRLSSDVEGNDKAHPEIQQIILKVTGIEPQELLSFDPLTGSDIPTRMRWAASRITTREEDRAYSLMGIFGVNFSTSYGEGAEGAFFRLIEAIITSRHTSHIIQVLHWAGKAVSDKVHPSRLIPSKPECYIQDAPDDSDATIPYEPIPPRGKWGSISSKMISSRGWMNRIHEIKRKINTTKLYPTLIEPMALTHLGLRVKLLVTDIPDNQIKICGPEGPGIHYGPFDIALAFQQNDILGPLKFSLKKRFPSIPKTVLELLQSYRPQNPARHDSVYRLIFGIYKYL